MQTKRMSVRQALLLGQLIVNGGVILIMVGVWILSFVVVIKANLSVWIILAGIFAGPLVSWIWWSFSTPRWRHWVRQYLDEGEIKDLHREAVYGQLEWPRGNAFERTEFKSTDHKQQDLDVVIKSVEKFLNDEAPGFISEFKIYFPDFDASIIDEIGGFIFNLRARILPTGELAGYSGNADDIDGLLARLDEVTDTLNGRQRVEFGAWLFVVSELKDRLNQIKMVLKAVR